MLLYRNYKDLILMENSFNVSLIKQLINFVIHKNRVFCGVIFSFPEHYYAFGKNLNKLNVKSLCKEYEKIPENWQRRILYGIEYEVINIKLSKSSESFVLILLESSNVHNLIESYKLIIAVKEDLSRTIAFGLWEKCFLEECKRLSKRIFSNLVFDSYILNLLIRCTSLYFFWVKDKSNLLHLSPDLRREAGIQSDISSNITKLKNFFNIPLNHPDVFHKETHVNKGNEKLKFEIEFVKFLEINECGIKNEVLGYFMKPVSMALGSKLDHYSLISQVSLPMAIIDHNCDIRFTNYNWQRFFNNVNVLEHIEKFVSASLIKKQSANYESAILRDHQKLWVKWYLDYIVQDNRIFILITVMDCTSEKLEEEERLLVVEKLKRSNEDLKRFAHICSHDLKEPLRTISNFAQIIKYSLKDTDTDINNSLDLIIKNTFYMKNLIENLLKYSEYEYSIDDLASVSAKDIIHYVINALSSKIKEKKAIIKVTPQLPLEIICNKIQIIQVFQNLIDNAIKFNEKKIPIVEVGYKQVDGYHRFSIKDNGMGIDNEYTGQLFFMFKRLHSRSEHSGSGIGLAMCKKIIENHKGKIWLESVLKEYTIVYFDIPIVYEELKTRCAG